MALSDYFEFNQNADKFNNQPAVSQGLNPKEFYEILFNNISSCQNHKDCHTQLYNNLRDHVIYATPTDGSTEKKLKEYIEANLNLAKYPSSIQLMNFTTKLLSEIPLTTKPGVFQSGTYPGYLQPFWCISESVFETKPFDFSTSENPPKRSWRYDDPPTFIDKLKKASSLGDALSAIFSEANQGFLKTWDHICQKCNYYDGNGKYVVIEGLVQKNQRLRSKGITNTPKTKRNQYKKSNSTSYQDFGYQFNFPFFSFESLNPWAESYFGYRYTSRNRGDATSNEWDKNCPGFRKNFLFSLDDETLIIEDYNATEKSFFRFEGDPVYISFRSKQISRATGDGEDEIIVDSKSFKQEINCKTPWKNWNGVGTPVIIYLVGDNIGKLNNLPLWMNRPALNVVSRAESVAESLYEWKLNFHSQPFKDSFYRKFSNLQFQKGLAYLIFNKSTDRPSELKQPADTKALSDNFWLKTNTPSFEFTFRIHEEGSPYGQSNQGYIFNDWFFQHRIFFGIPYFRSTLHEKVKKSFYKQNIACTNPDNEDFILVSPPIVFNPFNNWRDRKKWPKIKNKGRILGRNHSVRIPDQGTVMGAVHNYMQSTPTDYKGKFKGSKISATNFTRLTLENDPAGCEAHWFKLKPGAVFKDDKGNTSPPANQEWCHLMGHGDGGSQQMGNLVSGSWFCNSEQLAIEQGLRETTWNEKIADKYELRTTAYLFPNKTDFFDQPYLRGILQGEDFKKYQETGTGNSVTSGKNETIKSTYGKTMPVCAFIRYKIIKKDQGGDIKIFDHVFEGQGEFWDENQHAILRNFVKYLLAGEEVFKSDLQAILDELKPTVPQAIAQPTQGQADGEEDSDQGEGDSNNGEEDSNHD